MSYLLTFDPRIGLTSSPGSPGGSTLSNSPGGLPSGPRGVDPAPVSPSPQPASERAPQTNGTCGRSSDASSARVDPPSFLESKSPAQTGASGSEANRVCSVCETRKALREFYMHSSSLGGYRTQCKACCRKREAQRKATIPKDVRSKSYRDWRRVNRAKALLTIARYRAKQKGLEFDLDGHEVAIQDVIDAGVCELTGVPFNLDDGKTWDSPSLDRIDSTQGYTPRNVRVVLYCVNVMANLWGENKIVEIADAIRDARHEKSWNLQRSLESLLRSMIDTECSPEYVLTWKTWDMPSGPPICALRGRQRRTSDSGYTGWRSPNAASPNALRGTGTDPEKRLAQGHQIDLHDQVRLVDSRPLNEVAMLAGWPTTTAKDAASSGAYGYSTESGRHSGTTLTDAARLSDIGTTSMLSTAGTGPIGALNPEHSRWLMGFPQRWTNFAPTAMPSSRKSRRSSSERSSNTSNKERNGDTGPMCARIKVGVKPTTDTATPNGNGGGTFTLDLGAPPAAAVPTLDLGASFDLSGLDKKLGLTEADVLKAAEKVDTQPGPVPVDNLAVFEALSALSQQVDGSKTEVIGALTGLSENIGGLVDGIRQVAMMIGALEEKINSAVSAVSAPPPKAAPAPQAAPAAPELDDATFELLKRAHAQFSQQQKGNVVPFAALANVLLPHAPGATPQALAVGWRTLGFSLDQQGMVHF